MLVVAVCSDLISILISGSSFVSVAVVVPFRFRFRNELGPGADVVSGITSSMSGLDVDADAPVYAKRAREDRVMRRGGEAPSRAMLLNNPII